MRIQFLFSLFLVKMTRKSPPSSAGEMLFEGDNMQKIVIYLGLYFCSISSVFCAQTLGDELSLISAKHEMMGGSLVVFSEKGIEESLGIGKADFGRNQSVAPTTKYRIASISKTVTAIAVMQLVEQNRLNLDENISSILGYTVQNPNSPAIAITPRMLLSHTSTIIDGSTYTSFMGATTAGGVIPNLREILTVEGSFYTSGQFNKTLPGFYFNYANINFVILGTIIEKVSKLRFDVYCKKNICLPLGLDASFNVNDILEINTLAVLYRKVGGIWTPQADNFRGEQPIFGNLVGYIPGTNGGFFGPQGGFRCSAEDLAKIFRLLMNKGSLNDVTLLTQSSCDTMVASAWTFTGSNGNNYSGLFRSWGLGVHRITATPSNDIVLQKSPSMFGHTGEAYGLVSDAYFDPIRKVGLVFLTNGVGKGYQSNTASVFYTVEQEIFNAVENSIQVKIQLPPSSHHVSPGSTVVLTAMASGVPTPSLRWQRNGVPISNASQATLVLTAVTASQAGTYTCVATNAAGAATSAPATLSIAAANAEPGRLDGLAVLTTLSAGEPFFTVATVIGGAGTAGLKPLLIRASGPTLGAPPFGIPGTLPDPRLELFSPPTALAANDNWGTPASNVAGISTAIAARGLFPFFAATSQDAAAYRAGLPSGNYTVQVGDTEGGTGLVLAEIYDASTGAFGPTTPRLVSLAVLKVVPAEGLVTLGFNLGGTTAKTVLIRALGPTLGTLFSVPNAMPDPRVALFAAQANTPFASNDNWGGDAQVLTLNNSVTFAPISATSRDAIMVITLNPGGYTVEARPVIGSSGGSVLAEVYELP